MMMSLFPIAKVWGPPDGKPVIACHGWLDNAGAFDNLIPLLPKNLRIISLGTKLRMNSVRCE